MANTNNPVLVATVGMTYQDVQKRSTLHFGEGFYDNKQQYALRDHKWIGEDQTFDWHIPDSRLSFQGCRYYWLQTGEQDDPHIVYLWVTTAQGKLSWAEMRQQIEALQKRLHEDGWKPDQSKDEDTGHVVTADQTLKDMVEHPDLKNWDNELGGASYGRGDVALSVSAKRLSEAPEGRSPLEGKEFIYWIEMETRQRWEHSYKESGVTLPK